MLVLNGLKNFTYIAIARNQGVRFLPMATKRNRQPARDKQFLVGRRESNPILLGIVAIMWIVVGAVCGLYLHASWRLIPAILSLGIGLAFLRGAAGAYVRRMR